MSSNSLAASTAWPLCGSPSDLLGTLPRNGNCRTQRKHLLGSQQHTALIGRKTRANKCHVALPVCFLPTSALASTLPFSLCAPPKPHPVSAPCRQDGNGVVRALVELGVIKPQGDMLSVRRAINYFIENIKRQTERQETIGVSCREAEVAVVQHRQLCSASGIEGMGRVGRGSRGHGFLSVCPFRFSACTACCLKAFHAYHKGCMSCRLLVVCCMCNFNDNLRSSTMRLASLLLRCNRQPQPLTRVPPPSRKLITLLSPLQAIGEDLFAIALDQPFR